MLELFAIVALYPKDSTWYHSSNVVIPRNQDMLLQRHRMGSPHAVV